MNTHCALEGCPNAALPGKGMCANHISTSKALVRFNSQILGTTATNVPLWRKPGRYVPWMVLATVLAMTCMYTTMIFWWVVFTPIAFLGWHFGMNNTGKGS